MEMEIDSDAYHLCMTEAFIHSKSGNIAEAIKKYREAGEEHVQTQLTRHRLGVPDGIVKAPEPTEDRVVTSVFGIKIPEFNIDNPKNTLHIDWDQLKEGIRNYKFVHQDHHVTNLTNQDLPHTMVLSPGRSGTMSLYKLFQKSNKYVPYHAYHFGLPVDLRMPQIAAYLEGNLDYGVTPPLFIETHAAEWLGCMHEGKAFINMNHLDTVFAPVFKAIHKNSKYIYLRRNPKDVFWSFYSKDQTQMNQLYPVHYGYENKSFINFRAIEQTEPQQLAWYLTFTEKFSRIIGELDPDNFIEISADKLFNQDREEIDRLINFTGLDLTLPYVMKHFEKPINEKKHKVVKDDKETKKAYKEFLKYYEGEL